MLKIHRLFSMWWDHNVGGASHITPAASDARLSDNEWMERSCSQPFYSNPPYKYSDKHKVHYHAFMSLPSWNSWSCFNYWICLLFWLIFFLVNYWNINQKHNKYAKINMEKLLQLFSPKLLHSKFELIFFIS